MPGSRFTDIRRFESIDSTNRYLLEEARRGAPGGVVAVADHQSAGRGRLGRRWEAPPGSNLLMSVLLRPDLPAGQRQLACGVVALAAIDAVASVTGLGVGIKWPNDLLGPDGRKLAGVLAETDVVGSPAGSTLRAPIVVGIGVNVNWPGRRPRPPRRAARIGHVAAPAAGTARRPLRAPRCPARRSRTTGRGPGVGPGPGPPGRRLPGPVHHARSPGAGGAGRRGVRGPGHGPHSRGPPGRRGGRRRTDGGDRRRRAREDHGLIPRPRPSDLVRVTFPDHATTGHRCGRLHRLELRPVLGAAPSRRLRGGLRRPHLCRQPAEPGRRRGPDRLRARGHRGSRGRGQDPRRARDRRDRELRRRIPQQPGHPRSGPLLPDQRARYPDVGRGRTPARGVALPPHLDLRGLRRPPPRFRRGVHRGDRRTGPRPRTTRRRPEPTTR